MLTVNKNYEKVDKKQDKNKLCTIIALLQAIIARFRSSNINSGKMLFRHFRYAKNSYFVS